MRDIKSRTKSDVGELWNPINIKSVKNKSVDETVAITILNNSHPFHIVIAPEIKRRVPVNHLFLAKNFRTCEEEKTGQPAMCDITTLGEHVPIPSTNYTLPSPRLTIASSHMTSTWNEKNAYIEPVPSKLQGD